MTNRNTFQPHVGTFGLFTVINVLTMSSKNNNKLPNNLPQLQNWIKRDAGSYRDEVRICNI